MTTFGPAWSAARTSGMTWSMGRGRSGVEVVLSRAEFAPLRHRYPRLLVPGSPWVLNGLMEGTRVAKRARKAGNEGLVLVDADPILHGADVHGPGEQQNHRTEPDN